MDNPEPESHDAAGKVVGEKLFSVIERQLMRDVRRLRLGLELQIAQYPWAQQELTELVGELIHEAELSLLAFRETRVAPSFDEDVLIDNEKRHYLTQFLSLQKANPSLDIDDTYRKMSIAVDYFYPDTIRRLAEERARAAASDAANAAEE